MWHAIASSRPPPSATALMAAITGLGQACDLVEEALTFDR